MAFRAGKRVEGLIDVALGCLLLRKTSSTPAVVPGAAPALAKAGVGGYYCIFNGCLIIISLNFVKNTNDRRKFRSQTSDNMDR